MTKTALTVTVHYEQMSRRFQRLSRLLPEAVNRGMLRMAQAVKSEFDITTLTWDRRPEFKIEPTGVAGHYRIGTDSVIYQYVDQGTRPHVIEARNAPFLVFAVGGIPKTQPGVIGSSNGRAGNKVIRKKRVNHPGTRARGFRDAIHKAYRLRGPEFVKPEIESVINGSGVGL